MTLTTMEVTDNENKFTANGMTAVGCEQGECPTTNTSAKNAQEGKNINTTSVDTNGKMQHHESQKTQL